MTIKVFKAYSWSWSKVCPDEPCGLALHFYYRFTKKTQIQDRILFCKIKSILFSDSESAQKSDETQSKAALTLQTWKCIKFFNNSKKGSYIRPYHSRVTGIFNLFKIVYILIY